MDKGDLYTLIGAIVAILIVAVVANHNTIGMVTTTTLSSPTTPVTIVPTQISVTYTETPTQMPQVNQTPQLPAPPYRILLTNNPFTYPVIHLPDHMETFGASNTPLRENVSVPFAFMEDTRGGLTTKFSVPYAVWSLNISVTATRQPQYAIFNMVLCDANTGTIITGAEVQNGGSMYKVVRNTGSFYMIVGTSYVDSYRITLETPLSYYQKAGSSS